MAWPDPPEREPIAVEFVATSITSGGDGEDQRPETVEIQAENPQLKFHNSLRGFLMCDVTPERWLTDYIVLDKVTERAAPARSRARWVVEANAGRLTPA